MKIIRYGDYDDIDVQFQDEFYYIKEHQTYSNFRSGSIKNPYDRTVFWRWLSWSYWRNKDVR